MLWYMMKTWAGGEERLVREIRRTVPPYLYHEAFVIYNERIWRRQGRNNIQPEPLFKGCVFLTCADTEPLLWRMEQVPAMARIMAAGYASMYPLMRQDVRFLEKISGENHIVRTSYLLRESEGSDTYRVFGPLEELIDNIELVKFRTRMVKTHKKLWGEDREIVLGIIANEDLEQTLGDENQEGSPGLPDHYTILKIDKDEEGKKRYTAGGRVTSMPKAKPELVAG